MELAPLPPDEPARLGALRRYKILDSLQEQAYDDLTTIAAQVTGTPIALISLVDAGRLWFKSKVGLAASQMPREYTFCSHAIVSPAVQNEEPFVVNDAHQDRRFVDNRAVLEAPHIRFYAAAPLVTPDGFALGTLCTIDRVPRELDDHQLKMLTALSRQVVTQLELRRSADDLARVAQERERYALELEDSQRQLQQLNAVLQAESRTDRLTQLGNRMAFDEHLSLEHYRVARYQSPMSLFMIDVDHFKDYNDRFGHLAGDHALQLVAEAVRASLRESDFAMRYGGEEFTVIAPHTGRDGAWILAERIRHAVQEKNFPHRNVTVSIGVAALEPPPQYTSAQLLEAADKALYAAKEAGRNRSVIAGP
jgi:diguanylate cyclase (GGDEF)-like protein